MWVPFSKAKAVSRRLIATAYSTGPYLFFSWPLTLLTHVMSRNELALVDSINVVILYWVALLVFLGVRTIHNYSIPKAAGTSALTVFGMMVVIGVLALVYALTEQMFSFARRSWWRSQSERSTGRASGPAGGGCSEPCARKSLRLCGRVRFA